MSFSEYVSCFRFVTSLFTSNPTRVCNDAFHWLIIPTSELTQHVVMNTNYEEINSV